jgi:hypothetical protein
VVILRTFLALLAGFLTIAVLVGALTAVLARFAPQWSGDQGNPRPAYVALNIGYSFLAAVAGGYVTALMPSANPLILVLALAIIVLALAALSALQARGKQPVWRQLTLVAITPVGVMAGGILRLKVLGVL